MKVLRAVAGILYLTTLVFGLLDLTMGISIFKTIWQSSLGLASLILLFISITQSRKK